MLWLRKLAAIMLISFGAALAGLPFPTQLAGEREEKVLSLQVAPAPFTEETAGARFSDRFVALSAEDLAELPALHQELVRLTGGSGEVCLPPDEWHAASARWPLAAPGGGVYAFRDGVYRISSVRAEVIDPEGEVVCFNAELVGAYDNLDWGPMTHVDEDDLRPYPALAGAFESLAAGPLPAEGGGDVPVGEWQRFHSRLLDDLEYRPYFVVFDRLFTGALEDQPVPWSVATPWLRPAAGGAGGIVLALGIVLLVGTYRASTRRPGIAVAPMGLAVLCDAICLGGGTFFAGLAIDTLWVGPLRQPSLVGLLPEWPSQQTITGLHFVSLPAMLLALPLITLFFTSLSAQRIQVDGAGVTSHGALGSTSVSWEDLEGVRLREQRNPFAFSVFDFRKLQRVLDLEGTEHSITVNEPSSRRRKRQLLDALRQHAPADARGLMEGLEERW